MSCGVTGSCFCLFLCSKHASQAFTMFVMSFINSRPVNDFFRTIDGFDYSEVTGMKLTFHLILKCLWD